MTTFDVAQGPALGAATAGRRAAVIALARVEAVRILRHPAFLVGLAASLAAALSSPGEEEWVGQRYYLVSFAWLFAWIGTLVAAALVAGRQRMLGEPDLFPATAVNRGDRVVATALALLAPVVAVGAGVALFAWRIGLDGGFAFGNPPFTRMIMPPLAEWAQLVLLVALAGVIGIAVAHLRRGRVAALLALSFATLVGGSLVWMFQAHPLRVLHPFMYPSYDVSLPAGFEPAGWGAGDPPLTPPGEWNSTWLATQFDTTALWWHLLYVAGLILLIVWWAWRAAHRGEAAGRRWLLLAAVPLVLVAGIAQVLTAGVNG